MAKYLLVFIFVFLYSLFLPDRVRAIYDPLSVPNNKIGIHILFPGEIQDAAAVVNNGEQGSWGYVTIPIQATDRDRLKWQQFFDKCVEKRIIPIIRVATVPNSSNWEEPNNYDLIDFANFLNDLKWPVRNRYVIIFNEVNRPDEYGGAASPERYADILSNAIDIFKARSDDFFVLPAGLDNAAISAHGALNWRNFLQRMYFHRSDIFDRIDGWTSHAYPNPDFSVRPDLSGPNKIDSFRYDLQFLKRFTGKSLPIFITEAGWSGKYLTTTQIAHYYQYAFSKVWSDPRIVAVTPFLLNAQEGPFTQFSFLNTDSQPKAFSRTLSDLAIKGEPGFPEPTPVIEMAIVEPSVSPAVLGSEADSLETIKKLYNNLKAMLGLLN